MDIDEKRTIELEERQFNRAVRGARDPILLLLRAHLLIESYRLISSFLPRGNRLVDTGALTYAQKLTLVQAFDVVDDMAIQGAKNLNKVRNSMAHEEERHITMADVELIGRPFGKLFTQIRRDHGSNLKSFLKTTPMLMAIGFAKSTFLLEQTIVDRKNEHEHCASRVET